MAPPELDAPLLLAARLPGRRAVRTALAHSRISQTGRSTPSRASHFAGVHPRLNRVASSGSTCRPLPREGERARSEGRGSRRGRLRSDPRHRGRLFPPVRLPRSPRRGRPAAPLRRAGTLENSSCDGSSGTAGHAVLALRHQLQVSTVTPGP